MTSTPKGDIAQFSALNTTAATAAAAGFRLVAIATEKAPAHPAGFMKTAAGEVTTQALAKIADGGAWGVRVELGERGARPTTDPGVWRVPLALEWEGKAASHAEWLPRWTEAVDLAGAGDLIERLDAGVVQGTPSGGRRWFFEVAVESPSELMQSVTAVAARWRKPGGKPGTTMVMAELLTQHAIIAPSYGRAHPTGQPYTSITGVFTTDLPQLTPAEVDVLAFLLEQLSDEGIGGPARETVSNLTPRARQVRAAFSRGNGTAEASLNLLLAHGWTVLHGTLPAEVALIRPGSASRKAHAFVGGPDREAGQVSQFSTSETALPAGRHTAFDVVTHLEHGGDADKAAAALMRTTPLPAMVLRAVERPLVDVGQSADSMTATQELVTAVGRARSNHEPGAPLAFRQVASNGALVGVLVPQRGLAPQWITERSAGSMMLRCAQPVTGYKERETPAGVEYIPVMAHGFPDGIKVAAWQELQAAGVLPTIEVLASEPVILPRGRAIAASGYHRQDRVLLSMPARERAWWADGYRVPERPTQADAQAALDLLLAEVFVDFPFVDDGDRAGAVACLLTATAPHLASMRPGFGVLAPDRGTGKSLLFEAIRTIAAGSSAAIELSPYKRYDDESRKALLAGIQAGHRFVGTDNVDTGGTVTSTLATTLITKRDGAESIRILGTNDEVAVSGLVWMWAGNSIAFGGDLQRRVLVTDLEVSSGLAFERSGFRHPELIRWVRENRPQLLAACHTILAYGLQNPPATVDELPFRLASFEEWTRAVVGSLSHLTIGSENAAALLNTGRKEFVDSNDAEAEEWVEFLEWLASVTAGVAGVTSGQVADLLDPPHVSGQARQPRPVLDLPDRLDDVMRNAPRQARPRKVATILRTVARRKVPAGDRILKLVPVDQGAGTRSKKSVLWRVEVQARHASAVEQSSAPWSTTDEPLAAVF